MLLLSALAMPRAVVCCSRTMDELFEVISERQLQMTPRPIILLNVDGFYDTMVSRASKCTVVVPDTEPSICKACAWTSGCVRHPHVTICNTVVYALGRSYGHT